MTQPAEETREGIVFLKRIISYDKLFGSATLVAIVGIIWWAAVTDTKVEAHDVSIIEIKKEQKLNNEKVDNVVATPVINTAQIKVLQDDVSGVKTDVASIKNQMQKKDSSSIKMYDMLKYLYDKNKK